MSPNSNMARGRAVPMAKAHSVPINIRNQSKGVAKLNYKGWVEEHNYNINKNND